MDNKGFAISSILYSIFLLFIMLLILIMSNLSNSRLSIDKLKNEVKDSLDEIAYDKGESGYATITFANDNVTVRNNEPFDLMAGVSVVRYDGVPINQTISYESSPEFDSTKIGNYVITYSVTIDNKTYTKNRLVSVVDSSASIFSYTGNYQTFTAPKDGYYNVELWGAEGGGIGGYGAYINGKILLKKDEKIYIYAGQAGTYGTFGNDTTSTIGQGAIATYNGGGAGGNAGGGSYPYASYRGGCSGGGSTDIRLSNGTWNDATGLKSRIMVAAGGGGTNATDVNYDNDKSYAGGLVGQKGGLYSFMSGYPTDVAKRGIGGMQTSGNAFGIGDIGDNTGGVGFCNGHSGGGGGYYGGTGGEQTGANCHMIGGGGGSSFVSGYAGVNAVTSAATLTHSDNTIHYSNKYFIDSKIQTGINIGNGKAVVTYVSVPEKKNTLLNNVRYIKDCINGSSANVSNHWVELQAIYEGINVAKGKTVTGTVVVDAERLPYTAITDGDITSANYAKASATGLQCITVDLGQSYNLDEVAVWHYYADSRTYNNNVTYVSSDNTNWQSVINTVDVEKSNGKRISAYITTGADSYVQNGLLAHLDGINNTGTGHNLTTTVWSDLSGNGNNGAVNNFTMSGQNGWTSNALSFTKGNSHVQFSKPLISANGDFTIEIILLNRDISVGAMFIGQSDSSANRMGISLEYNSPYLTPITQYTLFKNKNGQTNTALSHLESDNSNTTAIQSIVVTRSGTKGTFRLNNNITDSKDTLFDYPVNQANTDIGYWGTVGSLSLNANIYSVRIYNRALTNAEITQNYNIDKQRFEF